MQIDLILLGAAVFTVIAVVQVISVRLLVSQTMLIALVGICFGAACLLATAVLPDDALTFVSPILAWRMSAANYLAIFLPTLLFQAALSANVRDMAADWVPILLLAVFAVFVATAMIGMVASGITGHPLTDGLLLGAIVATTDPSAVIAVFRSVGAPARLTTRVSAPS
ncbi:cation:proton antiporter [Caballeronia sp. LjRoot34]|uniref:cation:proton antiporter domain-containing protein n=1 Tax=Caballeronia sp. LjRoot34 TaxID=3342325 RepID=UPI003ECCE15F